MCERLLTLSSVLSAANRVNLLCVYSLQTLRWKTESLAGAGENNARFAVNDLDLDSLIADFFSTISPMRNEHCSVCIRIHSLEAALAQVAPSHRVSR